MEEKTYLGAQWGTFQNDKGQSVPYANAFFMEQFPNVANSDYHTTGYKAAKYKLTDPKLVEGLEPLDVVEVYFSSKGAVTKLVKKDGGNVTDMTSQKKAS